MALDLVGIRNENEYYAHYYLTAILENDLKGVFAEWSRVEQEQKIRPPYAVLGSLSREFFVIRNRMERLRAPAAWLEAQYPFIQSLLEALGYEWRPGTRLLEEGSIPIVAEVMLPSGAPAIWILQTAVTPFDPIDSLETVFDTSQFGGDDVQPIVDVPLEEIISRMIFRLSEPPRWILTCNLETVMLIDRSKWNEKRFLRFNLSEIFSRKESSTLKAMAALLHKDSICPQDGTALLDTLDENSHKHAFQVSKDLKYSAREAVELLGNEAVHYLRNVLKEGIYGKSYSEILTAECLRYLYRLLFLFYLEARPELGYAPLDSSEYLKGYSLETLRDLELTPLTAEESRNGFYISDSLKTLFRLIYEGFNHAPTDQELGLEHRPLSNTFQLAPLNSHLFDPEKTPLLSRVRFRNSVLQRVLELLSLSRPTSGKGRRGRISYAQLGINQLGAVYEGLLSYSGFFAEKDLFEVKKPDEDYDELETAYFVEAGDLSKYEENEKVYNPDGTLKTYPKGTFIYRQAGRSRQKSASYYTPEVLTQCLIKYALKELLKDRAADEILSLTVCEMALGSGAFANEAVEQLAEAYLDRKQNETGRTISHDAYGVEKQKVKMYLADHNVFGVDLNPVAVELAEISLWLNTIFEGAYVPWFGMQLVKGNSLIGARRQTFPTSSILKKQHGGSNWLASVPDEAPLNGGQLAKGRIFHFLLPDAGMTNYTDKVVKNLAKPELEVIKNWRKAFTLPFEETEAATLERFSRAVERLWRSHIAQQRSIRERTRDVIPVFGQETTMTARIRTTTRDKDRILQQEFYSENVRNSSSYRRLKLVLDYWCALWFWPINQASLLPTRDEYLMDLAMILEANVYQSSTVAPEQMPMFADTAPRQEQLKFVDEFGFVNVDSLCESNQRLRLAKKLAEKYRFHHWELEFADVFAGKGGFDVIVGNPPWIKMEWNEGGLLGDYEPLYVIRKMPAPKLAELRHEAIESKGIHNEYLSEYEEMAGIQNFLNALQNYPFLQGTQSNTYKCFLPQSWKFGSPIGVAAFLHPEGVYDDPRGGRLRSEIFRRLVAHFQFQNELKLFADVHDEMKFSVNISMVQPKDSVTFDHIANLFAVGTIDECYVETQGRKAAGIKNDNDTWNTEGHPDRLIRVSPVELALFVRLYDEPGTQVEHARLPAIHSVQILSFLEKFATQPRRLSDLRNDYFSTEMWHETNSQKDGTIKRITDFPTEPKQLIVSGPHFGVANPLFKCPRTICESNSHYDPVDLTIIPDAYLPRSNYFPSPSDAEYSRRIASVPWSASIKMTDMYRLIFRSMLNVSTERTLYAAVIPPNVSHTNGCRTYGFKENRLLEMTVFGACCFSLIFDAQVKILGRTNLHQLLDSFPLLTEQPLQSSLELRFLSLVCLTKYYSRLWENCWDSVFRNDQWVKADIRLDQGWYKSLTNEWQRGNSLRTHFARRQALVELDVLVSIALGLSVDELQNIYRVQFPVLRSYEDNTWYDAKGRIIFTSNRGLPGVGLSRDVWVEIRNMGTGVVEQKIIDDNLPGGPQERTISYFAPFDRCDREDDYATVWRGFLKRFSL
jgi:methylase of polypeptide subunit release factors